MSVLEEYTYRQGGQSGFTVVHMENDTIVNAK